MAQPYIEAAAWEGKDRVVLMGIAQEKASVWRSCPQKGQEKKAHPHMDWGREPAFINHFYFYLWDSEWGGCFWKTNAYAPFPIWLWLNGHEWAKRLPVLRADTAPDSEIIRIADDRLGAQRPSLFEMPAQIVSRFVRGVGRTEQRSSSLH